MGTSIDIVINDNMFGLFDVTLYTVRCRRLIFINLVAIAVLSWSTICVERVQAM